MIKDWLEKTVKWDENRYSSHGNILMLNNGPVAVSYYISNDLYVLTNDPHIVDELPPETVIFSHSGITKDFIHAFSHAYCLYRGFKRSPLLKSQFEDLINHLKKYKYPIPDKIFQALSMNDVDVFNTFFLTPKRFRYMVVNKAANWTECDTQGGYYYPNPKIRVFENEEDATFIKMKYADEVVIYDISINKLKSK